jgi:2-desacetyl-2-hydroxyethyl bacteriochlorophyllide A dehydrogenase
MLTALFLHGREPRLERMATPSPMAGEVLIRIEAAGICGSDLHVFSGINPWGPLPDPGAPWFRSGHELAGVVAEVGTGVRSVRVGQRVAVEPMHLVGCGHCEHCRAGKYNVCASRGTRDGARIKSAGFSEYDVASESNVYALPEQVSMDSATLLDDYACAVHAIHRAPFGPKDDVVIIGTGAVGLTLGQVARARGARQVIMLGRRRAALDRALEAGAADTCLDVTEVGDVEAAVREATAGRGARVVYEAVGGETHETLEYALAAAAPGGVIAILGAFAESVSLPYGRANRKEIELRWSNSYSAWQGQREFALGLELLASGKLRAEALVTHALPLTKIAEAFAIASDKPRTQAVKVVLHPGSAHGSERAA